MRRRPATVAVASLADLFGADGLVAIPPEVSDTPVLIRTSRPNILSRWPALRHAQSLDDLFDSLSTGSPGWRGAFLQRVHDLAEGGRLLYIVPGHSRYADATVACLADAAESGELSVEFLSAGNGLDAHALPARLNAPVIALVDILSLADTLSSEPFAGGRFPFHPAQAVAVTNLSSIGLVEIARAALYRRYPASAGVHVIEQDGQIAHVSDLESLTIDGSALPVTIFVEPTSFERGSRAPDDLQHLVARLRAPGGCPWDREQTHESLARNLIEETYETLDALQSGDPAALRDELGDYLLQAILHAQIAEEQGDFSFEDIVESLIAKLVRRHPHVFGSVVADDTGAVLRTWDDIKRAERRSQAGDNEAAAPLGRIPPHLPALMRAQSLIRRARRAGYSTDLWLANDRDQSTAPDTNGSDQQDELLKRLLAVLDHATVHDIDLEATLRGWTKAFETRVASERDAANSK